MTALPDSATRPVPSADDVLAALDPEQREVASSPLGPMCVLAGAGTGKTRAITHRIAYGVHSGAIQPQRVLAVTFTARAAGEMRARLRGLGVAGVQARTFHAAALRQLHYFWPQAIGGAAPEVLPHKAPVVAEAASRLRMQFDRTAIRDLAAEVEWAKVSLLTSESYAEHARSAGRDPAGIDLREMARLLETYEECKTQRGVIDFEDVLLLTAGILAERDEIARTVRGQYRHFVVDEYQDVNTLQQRLLDLWLGERDDICVVGDPAQTIYSFTGASPDHLLRFPRRYPSAQVVRLVRNYRSTPQIVALANLVSRAAAVRSDGARATPPAAYVELVSDSPAGPDPTLRQHADDPAEAAWIADEIAGMVGRGHPASEIAVLMRTNAQSEAFEAALAAAGVPYLVRGGERFFARPEVRQGVLLLRAAARSDDGSVPFPDLVRDVLGGAGWTPEAPSSGGAVRERWESLSALATLADDLAMMSADARIADLVRDLDERAAAQHAPAVQGITLASLHAAKGLEWDTVFLAGCSDGFIPITLAEGPAAIEEERRLLYVGVTRARRDLRLSWAAARNPGGHASRRPSRFLDPAAAVLGPGASSAESTSRRSRGPAPARRAPAACRSCGTELTTAASRKIGRCASCPPTYDESTFEALRTWRVAVARAAAVPAYVIFTDATLVAIAETKPVSLAGLAAISGVGARKLEAHGAAVLAVLGGAEPEGVARDAGAATTLTPNDPGSERKSRNRPK
jgi:DNA helicase-2/ATP-dependent DNA helicase PcrA